MKRGVGERCCRSWLILVSLSAQHGSINLTSRMCVSARLDPLRARRHRSQRVRRHATSGKTQGADGSCHDLTVPYPTATFSLSDPFEGYDAAGIHVDADENNILRSWHQPDEVGESARTSRKDVPPRPLFPPFLYLRWPFTYASPRGHVPRHRVLTTSYSSSSSRSSSPSGSASSSA